MNGFKLPLLRSTPLIDHGVHVRTSS